MSLYLKYRPKTFADVVGQSHITDILLAQAEGKVFSHNYLLYGPRGTGKTTTARLLAKMVNAESSDLSQDPLAALIDAGQTLDFVEIDAASHTGVDNIREEIIDKALYPPTQLTKKVYIIDEVHMLSKGAFNALLKIMEEPPEYLMFVLATTEINKVPDTIVSRCQVFNFKRIGIEPIIQRLQFIAKQEGISYEEQGLRLIAKLSSGALRDAIKYLEQVSMLGTVTAEQVSQFLGVVSDSVIEGFIQLVLQEEYDHVCKEVDHLYAGGTDLTHFTKDILLWLDEHFMENPAIYAELAQTMTNIYSQVKRYPYPVLVYKSVFHRYFYGQQGSSASHTGGAKPDTHMQKKKQGEGKIGSTTNKPKEMSLSHQEIKQVTSSSTSVVGRGDQDLDALMQQIIGKVDKVMVKSILKKNAILQSLEDNVLAGIVINQQYFTTLQKAEVVSYLQKIVSEIIGSPTKISWTYMTKDDYLQQAMKH